MASQLALKSRIASTGSLEKIFNAQEMIAASHIAQARQLALDSKPYTDAIFDAVQTLVSHTHISHPIVKKDEGNPRVAVLALTADRGMAGAYTSSIIRETEDLLARLEGEGKQPQLYVYGWLTTITATVRWRSLGKAIPRSLASRSPMPSPVRC